MIAEKDIKYEGKKGIPYCEPEKNIPDRGTWKIFKPVRDKTKCTKCLQCFLNCPDSAIKMDKNGFPTFDYNVCKGCMLCAKICPMKCISKVKVK